MVFSFDPFCLYLVFFSSAYSLRVSGDVLEGFRVLDLDLLKTPRKKIRRANKIFIKLKQNQVDDDV